MTSDPFARSRLRKVLVVVILATIPCYCAGLVAILLAPGAINRASGTPTFTSTWTPVVFATSNAYDNLHPLLSIVTVTPSQTPTPTTTGTTTYTPTITQTPTITTTPTPSNTPFIPPTFTKTPNFTATYTSTPYLLQPIHLPRPQQTPHDLHSPTHPSPPTPPHRLSRLYLSCPSSQSYHCYPSR